MGEGTERRWEEGLGEEKGMEAMVGFYIYINRKGMLISILSVL